MAGFYENITVSAAVPNAAADAEAAKDAAVTAKNEAEAAKDAAEIAKNLAEQHKDTASGYVGTVSGAQSIADANVASTAGDKQAAEDARDLALQYRNTAQSASTAATNAVNQVSANAATVAGMSSKIDAVYNVRTDITDVANNLTGSNTIGTVATYVNQIDTVSSNITAVTDVRNNNTNISTVATNLQNADTIGTVAGLAPKINTVAGLSSELTTVHGNNDDITTVATSLNAGNIIANVSSSIGNVNNVGNKLAEIEAVKNALSDIAAVENKLTEIDSVSDSITNVDSVAGVISEVQTVAGVSDEVKNLSASTGNMATLVSKLGQTTDLAGAVTDAQNSATSAASSASTASTHANTASGHASTAATHAANLGSVAYQNLTAIAESKSRNAADVFVYDTSKDSDGGAWRNRTQGKSWYNEALSNSTRGATKKFPAVAVIVGHNGAGNDGGVDIYDATDPTCPLWMRFEGDYSWGHGKMLVVAGRTSHGEITSVTMRDAKLFVGCKDQNSTSSGLFEIDFMTERCKFRKSPRGNGYNVLTNHANIAARNESEGISPKASGDFEGLISSFVNDVAVTVLPNAPIDPDTGLPVPTITVATNGGVSVIKDDGSVVDITGQVSGIRAVAWMGDKLVTNGVYGDAKAVYAVPSADQAYSVNKGYYVWQNPPSVFAGSTLDQIVTKEDRTIVSGCAKGLQHIHHKDGDSHASLSNQITSSYNTGWMNGDIKLATLMDTTAETISAPELVTNGDFSSFGSNLITNGEFPNNADGWTTSSGDWEWDSSGRIERVAGTANSPCGQTIPIVDGKIYKYSYDVVHSSGDSQSTLFIDFGNGLQQIESQIGSGTVEGSFTASETKNMPFNIYGINDWRGFVDNVVVQEVTGWSVPSDSNSTATVNNGALTGVRNNEDVVEQTLSTPLTAGETYNISFDITYISSNHWVYFRTSSQNITPNGAGNETPVGSYSHTFTATSNDTTLFLRAGGTGGLTFTIDNISLTKAEPDRSVNNNGLNIVGNVTKSAVATGAELVAYSGFSSSNYLQQTYNSDLDFGTGDFCITMWLKFNTDNAYDGIVDRAYYTSSAYSGSGFRIETGGSNSVVFKQQDGLTIFSVGSNPTGTWLSYTVTRKSGVIYVYVNGVLQGSVANTTDFTNVNAKLRVGGKFDGTSQNNTSTALFRISATAPTPEQIAKIYRDEKPLFQEGAKCTLYGNSNDVNGLSYDDDTGITHAGTPNSNGTGGISEFTGLQRTGINSNTTSVGVAVSAQTGLVVSE